MAENEVRDAVFRKRKEISKEKDKGVLKHAQRLKRKGSAIAKVEGNGCRAASRPGYPPSTFPGQEQIFINGLTNERDPLISNMRPAMHEIIMGAYDIVRIVPLYEPAQDLPSTWRAGG